MENLKAILKRLQIQKMTGVECGSTPVEGTPPKPLCLQCNDYGVLSLTTKDMAVTDPQFGRVTACPNLIHLPGRIQRRIELARVPSGTKPFADLKDNPNVEGLAKAIQLAQKLADGIAEKPWLVLSGPPGVGKSAIAGAAVLQRASKIDLPPGCFVVLRDALNELRRSYAEAKAEGVEVRDDMVEQQFPRLAWRGLVAIDDLGALRMTEWAEEQLMGMIDYRWREQLPTIITHDMERRTMAARLNARIVDRLEDREISELVHLKGPSYRSGRQW